MKEMEAQLAVDVAELLRRAEEVDEEEDRRYGRDKLEDELPEALSLSGRAAAEDQVGKGGPGSRGSGGGGAGRGQGPSRGAR